MATDPFEPIDNDDDDKDMEGLVDPLEALLQQSPAPLPVGPDGGFMPTTVDPGPSPKPSAETFICLRGPCRYYFETRMIADVHNRALLDKQLVAHSMYCHRMPGYVLDLMDEPGVLDCNEWNPYNQAEVRDRDFNRQAWLEKNPLKTVKDETNE